MKKLSLFLAILILLSHTISAETMDGRPESDDGYQFFTPESSELPLSFIDESSDPADTINDYLAEGYAVLDYRIGDINDDSELDLILVLKRNNERETSNVVSNPEPRPLLLIVNKGTHLALREYNLSVVLCVDCGGMMGDPFSGIALEDTYFSIEHYGGSSWRWTHIVTFRYDLDTDNWVLHKVGGVSFHSSDPEASMEEYVKSAADFGLVLFRDYDDADIRK